MKCDNLPALIIVKFCCCRFVDSCICMDYGEWQSVWYAEVLGTLQYTVLFSAMLIRCDFLFTVQGSITVTEPSSGRITAMLCMSPLWYLYNCDVAPDLLRPLCSDFPFAVRVVG